MEIKILVDLAYEKCAIYCDFPGFGYGGGSYGGNYGGSYGGGGGNSGGTDWWDS